MPEFSPRSKAKLAQCDARLQRVFEEVVKHFDCTVLEGRRTEQRQNELFRTGKSKVQYPNSKHNATVSLAADVAPYPIDWNDTKRFYLFGGFVLGIARSQGVILRWGGDWDGDFQWNDQSFHDLPHFEIKE